MTTPPHAPATPQRPGRSRARRLPATAGFLLALALAVAALGIPVGWLWSAVAPRVLVGMSTDGPYLINPEPEEYVGADVTFLAVGLGAGAILAVFAWVVFRRRRGPGVAVALAVGSLAAGYVAWRFGRRIGLADYRDLLAHAEAGWQFYRPPGLRTAGLLRVLGAPLIPRGVLDAQALGAAATYTMLAGWSRYPNLMRRRSATTGRPPQPVVPGPAVSAAAPVADPTRADFDQPPVSSSWWAAAAPSAAPGRPGSHGAVRPLG